MTDAASRQTERAALAGDLDAQAALLVQRMRSDPDTWTWRVKAMAFLGSEAARRVVGWLPVRPGSEAGCLGSPPILVANDFGKWLTGLQRVCSREETVACPELEADPLRHFPVCKPHMTSLLCDLCSGTGKVTKRAPHEPTLVMCAVSAGRVVLEPWRAKDCGCETDGLVYCVRADAQAVTALDAAEAFANCPCDKHREAWDRAMVGPGLPDWLCCPPWSTDYPHVTPGRAIQSAARATSPEQVRAAIRGAVVPWLLGAP